MDKQSITLHLWYWFSSNLSWVLGKKHMRPKIDGYLKCIVKATAVRLESCQLCIKLLLNKKLSLRVISWHFATVGRAFTSILEKVVMHLTKPTFAAGKTYQNFHLEKDEFGNDCWRIKK